MDIDDSDLEIAQGHAVTQDHMALLNTLRDSGDYFNLQPPSSLQQFSIKALQNGLVGL